MNKFGKWFKTSLKEMEMIKRMEQEVQADAFELVQNKWSNKR